MSTFNYKNDRVDYGELLIADTEYELDQAVGMTYSLDMEALMGIPLCLGMGEEITTGQIKNTLYVLEAIRRTGKKLSIFCNAGSIKVPQEDSRLFALLENSIHEVRMPNSKHNFHPKLWILQYHNINDGRILIKVVVLSRNMTFDQSMDIAAEMTGVVGNRILKKNKPLADMLSFVSQYDQNNLYDNLISNINRVIKFDIDSSGCFENYAFHAFGIYGKDENGVKRIPEKKQSDARKMFSGCSSLFIISPFLTDEVIRYLLDDYGSSNNTGPYRRCLITRESSVTNRIMNAMNKRNSDGIWVVAPVISSNEALDDGDTYGYTYRDIHAKVYYTEKTNEPHKLYLGSMNASKNAFDKNIEFLLELQYKKSYVSYQKIKNDFLPEKENPFIKLEELSGYDIDKKENDVDFRDEVYSIHKAEVIKEGDTYSIRLFSENEFENVTIRPFFVKTGIQQLRRITVFQNIPINKLSNMFVIRKEDSECLVRLDVEGMPEEEREDAIFNDIITDHNLFMTYMRYLLDEDFYDNVSYGDLLRNQNENGVETSSDSGFSVEPDIYEKMLKAAADNPERFDAMYEIAGRLKDDRTGAEFMQLLNLFMKATGRNGSEYSES